MSNPEVHNKNKQYELIKPLSLELSDLVDMDPKLLGAYRPSACEAAHTNFIASILVKLQQKDWEQRYEDRGFCVRPEVSRPISIVEGEVPLMVQDMQKGIWRSTDHVVGSKVVIKHACGGNMGLVIDGPYAGLLLKSYWKSKHDNGMRAMRLLNEESIGYGMSPYDFSKDQDDVVWRANNKPWQDLIQFELDLFHELTRTLRIRILSKIYPGYSEQDKSDDDIFQEMLYAEDNHIQLSDLLEDVSREADVPIVASNLHMIRTR